jgi:acyl-CoA synthetase (AMP-forming)/AMP-acid ligase II
VLRAGAAATSDTLRSYVRENLAGYKVPRVITILEELPRGGTGKVLRQELRARLGAER